MVNQPMGSIISETMSEQPLDPLKTLDGENLKLDGGGMYPSFKAPDGEQKVDNKQYVQNQEQNDENTVKLTPNIEKEKFFDINEYFGKKEIATNPATPTLKRVLNSSDVNLSERDLGKIYKQLKNLDSREDVLSNLIDAIDSSGIDKKTHDKLSEYITQIGSNSDSRLKEGKDGKIELPKEFKGNKLLENDKYQNIVNLLAKNYISFPNDKGNANFDKDLALSIETTVNKVVYGKNFSKNEGFELAMRDIYSKSLETRLEALNYIYLLVNTNEGKEGAQAKKIYKKGKKNEKLNLSSIEDRFSELKERASKVLKDKNNETLKQLEQETIEMKEEADNDGDIFISSDLDKIKGEIDSVLKETT